MTAIDWTIVAALLLGLTWAALTTRRHARSVGGFLVANRCGGRYLIAMAKGIAGFGVVTFMWFGEQAYQVGFTGRWWNLLTEPAMIVVAVSGWIVYRFRQTRAMTLAQFFEARYSRRFRVFAGLVAFLAGIINFGVFPAIGARFFIALCGLPDQLPAVAGLEVPTFPAVMALLLALALLFTLMGGHIAVMVTDFFQGIFANVVFALVCVFLLVKFFTWEQISDALLMAPPDHSLVDPFRIQGEDEFGVSYFLIQTLVVFYSVLIWQGTQAYEGCATSAHEAKMAGILNGWRYRALLIVAVVVPIGVYTLMHHPDFADQARAIDGALQSIEPQELRNQARLPLAIAAMLPVGLLGLFCAAMLAAQVSTDESYMHSWASILVQDVILPLRRKPFSPRQHLWALRGAILGVAVFAFLFGLLFEQRQKVAMFLTISGAIFFGGGGAAVIGGLYWRRGTTAGAWAGMMTGMIAGVFGVAAPQLWDDFPLTGQEMTFVGMSSAFGAYVLASLLDPRGPFDLDRLLHRGPHAVAGETSVRWSEARGWRERLGIDREFSGWDRVVAYVTLAWPVGWTLIFIAVVVWHLFADLPDTWWVGFWHAWTWIFVGGAIAVTGWFTIGGFRDLRSMYRHLAARANPKEDGRVEDGRNVGE